MEGAGYTLEPSEMSLKQINNHDHNDTKTRVKWKDQAGDGDVQKASGRKLESQRGDWREQAQAQAEQSEGT